MLARQREKSGWFEGPFEVAVQLNLWEALNESVNGHRALLRRPHRKGIDGRECGRYSLNSFVAGWSSPVARRAHNPKVLGSNPSPATKAYALYKSLTK